VRTHGETCSCIWCPQAACCSTHVVTEQAFSRHVRRSPQPTQLAPGISKCVNDNIRGRHGAADMDWRTNAVKAPSLRVFITDTRTHTWRVGAPAMNRRVRPGYDKSRHLADKLLTLRLYSQLRQDTAIFCRREIRSSPSVASPEQWRSLVWMSRCAKIPRGPLVPLIQSSSAVQCKRTTHTFCVKLKGLKLVTQTNEEDFLWFWRKKLFLTCTFYTGYQQVYFFTQRSFTNNYNILFYFIFLMLTNRYLAILGTFLH